MILNTLALPLVEAGYCRIYIRSTEVENLFQESWYIIAEAFDFVGRGVEDEVVILALIVALRALLSLPFGLLDLCGGGILSRRFSCVRHLEKR